MGETKGDLTPKRIAAIIKSIELGRTLQQEHPEIADLYRRGCTLLKIDEDLDIQSEYSVSNNQAQSSIGCALRGHEGGFKISAYEGLLSREEREQLGKEHKSEACLRLYEEEKGIHALTREERRENGRIGGGRTYERKKGIHALTPEQLAEASRKSMIVKGITPWSEDEKKEAYELSLLPEYRVSSRIDPRRIAEELNKKYHGNCNVRRVNSVVTELYRYRKSLEKKVEN